MAIVGPTGVGKSTLTQLMVRLVDPDEGHVEIGGVDLREVDVASLRASVAVVFQESFLFAESVRSNIALDSGRDDDEVDARRRDRGVRPVHQGAAEAATTRSSASEGSRSRAASVSAWRSRGRWCASHGC